MQGSADATGAAPQRSISLDFSHSSHAASSGASPKKNEVLDSFLTKIVYIYNMAFCAYKQPHHSGLFLSLFSTPADTNECTATNWLCG